MNLHSIDRRSFLRGVGVALALPMLESRARGAQPQRPRPMAWTPHRWCVGFTS